MAGAGLIAIKRRIRSINNTKKITKAIGLVATSKLRKSREVLVLNNAYYDELKKVMQQILQENEFDNNMYIEGNQSNKRLYISLTSDSGLCGGFNGNVVSKILDSISQDKENSKLIIVGQKGRAYFKRFNIEAIAEYVEIPDIPTIKEVNIILDKALELFLKEEVGEVNVVYTKFVSAVKQEVKVKRILPFDTEDLKEENTIVALSEFEPSREKMLISIARSYLNQTLLNLMLNAKTSEQQARMTSMDGATKNADDLLDKLNLKYNRIRQSAITQEISEIVGGAEAQR
ncbi:MAG: ATP synthase F1 subunit gamma [Clostridium sp.]|nr:ATP synthase F1 subunit gamma [Clostridium sp.]